VQYRLIAHAPEGRTEIVSPLRGNASSQHRDLQWLAADMGDIPGRDSANWRLCNNTRLKTLAAVIQTSIVMLGELKKGSPTCTSMATWDPFCIFCEMR